MRSGSLRVGLGFAFPHLSRSAVHGPGAAGKYPAFMCIPSRCHSTDGCDGWEANLRANRIAHAFWPWIDYPSGPTPAWVWRWMELVLSSPASGMVGGGGKRRFRRRGRAVDHRFLYRISVAGRTNPRNRHNRNRDGNGVTTLGADAGLIPMQGCRFTRSKMTDLATSSM